jgi:hypothetical protein
MESALDEHPGLGNVDSIQRVITTARGLKHGDGFEGILHEMVRPRDENNPSPFESSFRDYMQLLSSYGDGHVFDVCMFMGEYEKALLAKTSYMEVDVYFKTLRAPNTTLCMSTWDHDAKMQVALARVGTNHSSSEEQFCRMFLAIFNQWLDRGVRVSFTGTPTDWRFVADFCMAQAKGLARAAARIGGNVITPEDMLARIMDGCKTHFDRMLHKVTLRCVMYLEKTNRNIEKERIYAQLLAASVDSQRGAWQAAWDDIVVKYPHVQGQAEWWCNQQVMGMIVFAEKAVAPVASIPNSTNREEGRALSACLAGHLSRRRRGNTCHVYSQAYILKATCSALSFHLCRFL